MPIPVGDENDDCGTPVINYLIFTICLAVFVYEMILPEGQLHVFIHDYGYSAGEGVGVLHGMARLKASLHAILDWHLPSSRQAITMIFIHASPGHIFGNMLFLWIFGDNVEHVMGKLRYIIFFFLTGLLANVTQTCLGADTVIPNIGASGAISGVMGAYLMFYPSAYVNLWWYAPWRIMPVTPNVLRVRAWIYLLFCFACDMGIGLATMGSKFYEVAVWAHVGGFIAGALLAWPFKDPEMMFMADANNMIRGPRRRGAKAAPDIWEMSGADIEQLPPMTPPRVHGKAAPVPPATPVPVKPPEKAAVTAPLNHPEKAQDDDEEFISPS